LNLVIHLLQVPQVRPIDQNSQIHQLKDEDKPKEMKHCHIAESDVMYEKKAKTYRSRYPVLYNVGTQAS
jgi:hypothetical protein